MSQSQISPADLDCYVHRHREIIRWGDMDSFGHVNNVQFFRYLESARIAYAMAVMATEVKPEAENIILADIRCAFRRQLGWPGDIDVYTRTVRIGHTSIALEQVICRVGSSDNVATSESIIVWFDFVAQKPAPVPEFVRRRVLEFERVQPRGL